MLKTTSGRTDQSLKRKRNWTPKMVKRPNARLIQNVPPAAKLITYPRTVGVMPEIIFVPKEIDSTLKIQSPPKTKAPSLKLKNLQHLHHSNRTQRNLIQKTNFATTPKYVTKCRYDNMSYPTHLT